MKAPLMIALLAGLVVACNDQEAIPNTLSGIQPTHPIPGSTLILQGNFQSQTTVFLNGQAVPVTHAGTTIQLQIPNTITAGKHTIQIQPGDLNAPVTVYPHIQQVNFTTDTITMQVLGMGNNQKLNLTLNQQNQTILQQNGNNILVESPKLNLYGDHQYQLCVNLTCSDPKTITIAAGSATGTVKPTEIATPMIRTQSVLTPHTQTTLLVQWASQRCPENTTPCPPTTVPSPQNIQITDLPNVERWQYPNHTQAVQALNRLKQHPLVQQVSWDDDIQLESQHKILTPQTTQYKQWFWPLLGLTANPSQATGAGITVAIVDSGLVEHPEFKDRMLPGFNFVHNTTDTTDHLGHGTHVAGLIAAGNQLLSPAPKALLLPVKVVESANSGSVLDLTEGILWAANLLQVRPNPNPAQVINLSLAPKTDCPDLLVSAIQTVLQHGVIVIAATGNNLAAVSCVARIPGVLGVTALSGPIGLYQPSYATTGMGTGITAMGGDLTNDQDSDGQADGILSTDINSNGEPTYGLREGTSMATPQVTGMAARLLSTGLKAQLVKDYLQHHSLDLGIPGMDTRFGAGLVRTPTTNQQQRTYALIYQNNTLINWVEVDPSGKYQLNNLPPSVPLTILILTDNNGNCLLGEAGEQSSEQHDFAVMPRQTAMLPTLTLSPTNGSNPHPLGCQGEQP